MTATHRALRTAILFTCREMNALGLNQGMAGNVSARAGDGFLITPSGLPYETMRPGQLVTMDLQGGYRGDLLPSSEWRMHHDIYARRPEAGAVVHAHPTHCTALACLRRGIPAFHYMICVAGGRDIRCAEYATFGTRALSDNMLAALDGRSACLLANHGMICFGADLAEALWRAVEVEALARQYWTALQAGEPALLPDAEIDRVLERFRAYGRQAQDLAPGDAPAFELPERRDGPKRRAAKPRRRRD